MTTPLAQLADQLKTMVHAKGGELYGGEPITQEQHALQCAQLAENENAPAHMIIAALLHDIGHLVQDDFEAAQEKGEDRCHEDLGGDFLKRWFGPDVTEPVRLHVAAKRYLCATDPDYFGKLSPASIHTLKLQGGPMSPAEVTAFEAHPGYRDAVRLRIWDDLGKDPAIKTESLNHFVSRYAQACLAV